MFDTEIKTTTDHQLIRAWIERRGGFPAVSKQTKTKLRLSIHFPGYSDPEALEEVTWSGFFKLFDVQRQTFSYRERTPDRKISRFNKFASRTKARRAKILY